MFFVIEFKLNAPDANNMAQMFLEFLCTPVAYSICILNMSGPTASCGKNERANQLRGVAHIWPFN